MVNYRRQSPMSLVDALLNFLDKLYNLIYRDLGSEVLYA